LKVVTDTNVLYAAFVSKEGTCARLLELLLSSGSLVLSQFILDELRRHLLAKKRLGAARVDRQLEFLASSSLRVTPAEVPAEVCRDADDLPVLGTLVAANADCLVTGDRDLLDLGQFRGHPILSPRQFLQRTR